MTKIENMQNSLTDYEICCLMISSVATFTDVASKHDIEKGTVFDLGHRLFDESIESIKTTRKKLSA